MPHTMTGPPLRGALLLLACLSLVLPAVAQTGEAIWQQPGKLDPTTSSAMAEAGGSNPLLLEGLDPFSLMNALRKFSNLRDRTSPGSAVDEALADFEFANEADDAVSQGAADAGEMPPVKP